MGHWMFSCQGSCPDPGGGRQSSGNGGAAPLVQPSEHLVPPDPCVVADHQLGAIDKVDSGGLAAATLEQEVKGQQEPWHQGHKPAGVGEISKSSGPTAAPGRSVGHG